MGDTAGETRREACKRRREARRRADGRETEEEEGGIMSGDVGFRDELLAELLKIILLLAKPVKRHAMKDKKARTGYL